jgi:hypothetical protein
VRGARPGCDFTSPYLILTLRMDDFPIHSCSGFGPSGAGRSRTCTSISCTDGACRPALDSSESTLHARSGHNCVYRACGNRREVAVDSSWFDAALSILLNVDLNVDHAFARIPLRIRRRGL